MITPEQMKTIAEQIGLPADEFAQAISKTEVVELTLPNGRFLTKEKEEKLLDNHGKKKYDEGKAKRDKEVLPEFMTLAGLEGEIDTPQAFIDEFKAATLKDAQIEPNQKLIQKDDIINGLKKKISEVTTLKDQEIEQYKSKIFATSTKADILSHIPSLKEGYSKEDAVTLFMTSHERKEDGIYKNGVLLVNDVQEPLALDKVVSSFIAEKGWQSVKPGGNHPGGRTFTGSTPKTYEEFQAYCKSKNIIEGSVEANAKLQEFAKDNPELLN